MNQDRISALLGRPLSETETTNFDTYLELAQGKVSDILCVNICQEYGAKKFAARSGYQTLNVPIFTEIDSITLNGHETTKYHVRQGSNLNGDWYNSIVFDAPLTNEVIEVKADWGFSKTPLDVEVMIAELFSMATDSIANDTIQSKQVEDFRITFNKTNQEAFADKYAATIAKYSLCVNGNVQNGNVRHILFV